MAYNVLDDTNMDIKNLNVHGDFVLLCIGDLHISDKPSGKHRDYFGSCTDILSNITDTIRERKVTHLVLTGDLIGRTTEKNFQTREALVYFMKVLQLWNDLTNGNVFSLIGNHDMSEVTPDFEHLALLGYIKVIDSLEFDVLKCHMFNYGDHTRQIQVNPNKYNVAFMHTELHVEGATGWFFRSQEGVELSDLENLYGVAMVIAGHIHNPSVRVLETSIRDKSIKLFYPGNPTRPKKDNTWTEAYGVLYSGTGDDLEFEKIVYELEPLETFFAKTYADAEDEVVLADNNDAEGAEEVASKLNLSDLSEILNQLTKYNLADGVDYEKQISILAGEDKLAAQLAISTIKMMEAKLKDASAV